MQTFRETVQTTRNGVVVLLPSPTVTVKVAGTNTLAAIFADDGATPLSNPFTGSVLGLVEFAAPDGRYDIEISKPGFGASTYSGVVFYDPTDGVAGSRVDLNDGAGGSDFSNAQELADRVQAHIEATDAALENIEGTLDVGALELATTPVADADLMMIRQGSVNKKIPSSAFRAEFSTVAVAAQQAAEAAAAQAETYAAASASGARFFDTIALGLAGVTNGQNFGVVAGGADGLARATLFRRDSASTYTVLYSVASTSEVDEVSGLLPLFEEYVSNNIYAPDTLSSLPVGARAPANYNNGGTWGTSLAWFGTTGIVGGLVVGQTYTLNILGAPASVTLSRAQGGFFWAAGNVFSSQVAHGAAGMTFSADNRSVTFTAVTNRVSFNLVRAPTSAAMADVFSAVLSAIMVNVGSTPLAYEPKTPEFPFSPGPRFFPKARDTDDVVVQSDGAGFYYARTSWDSTYDKVQCYRFGLAANTTTNNLWDHFGERLILRSTALDGTKAGFDGSSLILRSAIDEGPPLNLNNMWLAGNHGPLCRRVTITGHGFVAGDLGSRWSDGVRNRILVQILDPNTVRFVAQNTGTTTNWVISAQPVSGSTLTHVSGGVATGTKTVTADVLDQAYPFIRSRSGSVTLDGVDISAPGTYGGKVLRFSEQYNIPNLARALDYMVANTTNPSNSLIHPSIGSHINFSMSHTLDWTGITRTVWAPVDVESYLPTQYGGAQTVRPETPAGGSLIAHVPRSAPFAGFNFAAGQNITTWSTTLNFVPADGWADPADPPSAIVFIAKDSSGNSRWGHFYALDDTVGQGKPAYRSGLSNALLFSSLRKAYVVAGTTGSTSGAGQVHETVNYLGTFNPALNPALTWAVIHPKGAKYALVAHAPGALLSQWVAVDSRLMGLPVTLRRGDGVGTLLTDVVQDQGVLITWSAAGEVEVAIG